MKDFIKKLKKKGYSFKIVDGKIIVNHDGSVDLELLEKLPKNTTFNNSGHVYLESLEKLPKNITFENKGDVDLCSLKIFPENTNFKNAGNVDLRSLKILPKNITFENKGDVDLCSLKIFPENLFRNPKTNRVVKKKSDGTFYAGCFKGNFEDLKKICLEKNFDEVLEWAEKLIIKK